MKTKLFTTFLLQCSVCMFLQAQSLQIYYDDKVVTEGQVITINKIIEDVFADPFKPEMKGPFYVKNITGQDVNVMIKKPELISALAPNAKEGFCWAMCYDESPTTEDGIPVTITPGETTAVGKYASYKPEFGSSGSTSIKYTFYVENNPNDKVSIIYKFSYNEGSGIKQTKKSQDFNIFSQNGNLKVNYNLSNIKNIESSKIEIFSITGLKMKSEKITGLQETTVKISDLPKGFYVCSLVVNGKSIASGKFIIHK